MKLSKEILEEGITEELINSLDFKVNGIKVQLTKEGDVFSRDKIEETIDKIQGNSHIRNVAMFNVEKKK